MDTQLDPLVGRESELERVIHILCRRTKNNPVLIGEAGVARGRFCIKKHPSSCGAICSKPALSQQVLTTYHSTFCEMPFPHTLPVLATARKILPSLTPAATVH
jgi:hypothetical protein